MHVVLDWSGQTAIFAKGSHSCAQITGREQIVILSQPESGGFLVTLNDRQFIARYAYGGKPPKVGVASRLWDTRLDFELFRPRLRYLIYLKIVYKQITLLLLAAITSVHPMPRSLQSELRACRYRLIPSLLLLTLSKRTCPLHR
jgi:hypothetical protein